MNRLMATRQIAGTKKFVIRYAGICPTEDDIPVGLKLKEQDLAVG